MKRVLVVEPYYGGSHKQFLLGLQKHIEAEFVVITLPARKWKMRMQLSAPWFVSQIETMSCKYFDVVLCSTFVDVAVLKALLVSLDDWNNNCAFCTYFHENQFVYPMQQDDSARHQFTSINYTTALVSDRLAFNSHYNYKSFIDNSSKYIKKAADIDIRQTLQDIERKSTVLYPGIDFGEFNTSTKRDNNVPIILWNHRWEHDKNPDDFFNALIELEEMGTSFKIIFLGQSFHNIPDAIINTQQRFKDVIEHFGFVESRYEYVALLQKSDIVVSTSVHEFFGISVIEAIRAGCYPIVPDRLSYPELYPPDHLYKEGQLSEKLNQVIQMISSNKMDNYSIDTDRFCWKHLRGQYREWLFGR